MEFNNPAPQAPQKPEAKAESNKSLIIAVVVTLGMIIAGASIFIGFDSANQYQGFLNKIEKQTEQLQSNDDNSIVPKPKTSAPLPASTE